MRSQSLAVMRREESGVGCSDRVVVEAKMMILYVLLSKAL